MRHLLATLFFQYDIGCHILLDLYAYSFTFNDKSAQSSLPKVLLFAILNLAKIVSQFFLVQVRSTVQMKVVPPLFLYIEK